LNFYPKVTRVSYFILALILAVFGVQKAAGEVEIDMGDQGSTASNSAPAPTATPVPQTVNTPVASSQPSNTPIPTVVAREQSAPASQTAMEEPTDTPTPAVEVVQGRLKAKDIYEAGIKNYKAKEYETAIRYLKKAVNYKDPYTPKYIYAEAYATLGVIYQFYYPITGHITKAITYYKAALRCEKNNRTAKKYLRKLRRYSR
jgi:tetratricopeptide (TPR) repeat protein